MTNRRVKTNENWGPPRYVSNYLGHFDALRSFDVSRLRVFLITSNIRIKNATPTVMGVSI